MENIIYVTIMCFLPTNHCNIIDQHLSVMGKQRGKRQTKSLVTAEKLFWKKKCNEWNIHDQSAGQEIDPADIFNNRMTLLQSKTRWITRPLAALWKKKDQDHHKHHLPVAPHKECQVCLWFRNVGNNPTNICPAYFGDRHPQGSYQILSEGKSEISANPPPHPL